MICAFLVPSQVGYVNDLNVHLFSRLTGGHKLM